MTAEEYVGKKVRLTKKFVQNFNTFKVGCVMHVIAHGDGVVIPPSVLLKDPRRPDLKFILGESEFKYMQIIHDSGRCYNCAKDVVSNDGRSCPECGKDLWELLAKHSTENR